jgi:ribosomal protein S18 acetylase RimI-like enzyme
MMTIQKNAFLLPEDGLQSACEFIRRVDLSDLPKMDFSADARQNIGTETLAVEPLILPFRGYVIDFIATGEKNDLSSLMIVVRDFPEPNTWWIAGLLVDPLRRRNGHASSLLCDLKSRAHAAGSHRLKVVVWADASEAVGFWKKFNFKFHSKLPTWRNTNEPPLKRSLFSITL